MTGGGIVAATVFVWPLHFAFRRANRIPEPREPKAAHLARWLAGAASISILGFVYLLFPWVTSDIVILSTYSYDAVISPGPLHGAHRAGCHGSPHNRVIILAFFAWKEKYWTLLHRVHYTVIMIALFALLWTVISQNLWIFAV